MCTDHDGRLLGVLSLSDIAQHESSGRLSRTLKQIARREVSRPSA
jgi:hypothetical protein